MVPVLLNDTHYAVADIEIINFVKEELEDPSRNILTKNIAEKMYKEIFADNRLKQGQKS